MTPTRRDWTRRMVLTAAGALLAGSVSGCAYWRGGAPSGNAQAKAKEAPTPRKQERRVPEADNTVLKLEIMYYQRIFIPLGARITVSVVDAKGRKASGTMTTSTAQPFRIDIPLGGATTGPLTVSVTLKSPTGHTLSGRQTLPKVPRGTTEIIISNQGA